MDDSERITQDYLKHLGFTEVAYEPEGKNKPPDFLVEQRIAIEVRRLNQHEARKEPGRKPRGLEELAIPLRNNISAMLPLLGPSKAGVSWFVYFKYCRPIPEQRKLKKEIRRHLEAFRDRAQESSARIQVFPNFTIDLHKASRPHADYFVMAGYSDFDSGGWVISELERNLKICIDENTQKISAIRAKYAEWWLVLIDRINYGEIETIQVPPHTWDKIILVDPRAPAKAFEVR
jgi:hypothetical protein